MFPLSIIRKYCSGSKACWRFGILVICFSLVLGLGLVRSSRAASGWGTHLATGGRTSAPSSIGLVDMVFLQKYHSKYDQLAAIDEQISIREKQWQEYIWLLTQQARLDGIQSSQLTEIGEAVNPRLVSLAEEAVLWDEARKRREEYVDDLRQQMTRDLDKREAELERDLEEEVANLRHQSQKAILKRQVKLALLSMTPGDAEVVLKEITKLQEEFEENARQLQEATLVQRQEETEKAEAAAIEQARSYDAELLQEVMSKIYQLESEPTEIAKASEKPADLWLAPLENSSLVLGADTASSLDRELLKAKSQWEEDMKELLARRNQVLQEMNGDLKRSIGEAARAARVELVLDKGLTQAQGIDLTSQVLDILRGKA